MKLSFRILVIVAFTIGLIWINGCNKSDPYSNSTLTKSSTALMKATSTAKFANVVVSDLPVTGGSLNVQTAWVNIAELRIEENSGFDGEQEGEHNDGDQGGSDNEFEAPDITAAGPFSLDISSGQALIDTFAVYPGTFKKVDFAFQPNSSDPFFGKTIVISGEFTSNAGVVTPFTLKSEFLDQIQTQVANGGITVAANSTVEINVVFDLAGWFSNVDFSATQVLNGVIQIDNANNVSLLSAFDANLAQYIEVEED